MKILVCGGREYVNKKFLYEFLDNFHKNSPVTKLIHGGAKGADSLAGEWAIQNKIETIVYKANWEKYGKTAGPIRNIQMLEEESPEVIIAFPGGKGTLHMINISKRKNFRVIEAIEFKQMGFR
jgi:hypothetical protein